MRSFIAISLSDDVKAAFAPLQRALPVGRLVSSDNMHLTLAFLDDQTEETLEELHEELSILSAPPFGVTFSGIESFGQVLAVVVEDCPALIALHQKIQTAMRRAGIVLPRRRFRPHVTIARFKPGQREAVQLVQRPRTMSALPKMPVTGFTLYQSTLRPEGARHEALAHYLLR
ncbi:RNA 2',3'-cyclic phosphodiesterase [Ruegeria lacuscaerulensis]|uniref:RNA 2',3'-cyclic phosphodiesterase n=1 Tax=Ruegeria lacuscaerulensis TaxID=55218 RepID=UPI00147A3486|nr:RNA 2',3'-cyclic phosphodiesterase [Ruegeria lacuscaerulensis]